MVHSTFAVPVSYYDKGSRTPRVLENPVTARLHNRIAVAPDPVAGGYAQIVEGVTRVIFSRDNLTLAGVAPKQGDKISFGPPYNVVVVLDVKDTPNGPVTEKWSVSRR